MDQKKLTRTVKKILEKDKRQTYHTLLAPTTPPSLAVTATSAGK